ncbi:MAG: hypothetical protein HPY66_2277 [Firmicutes bacterium]|nr:hypothetical protein [Bacillota bacterium]MDI6706725.1 diguanylate cyclase [Bacillota bacterium]
MNAFDNLEYFIATHENDLFSIVFFDLDRFNTYSQEDKTRLAHEVREFLNEQINSNKVQLFWAERDEFLLIMPGINKKQAKDFTDELLKKFAGFFKTDGLTCSAGIAQYPWDGRDAAELWRKAEEVLNKAKRCGRNRACIAEEKMVLRSNYYSPSQLERLRSLARYLSKSEAEILRESLELFLKKYNV